MDHWENVNSEGEGFVRVCFASVTYISIFVRNCGTKQQNLFIFAHFVINSICNFVLVFKKQMYFTPGSLFISCFAGQILVIYFM